MPFTLSHGWGIQSDITQRFGARLVQEGNRLHYLADRASLTGSFSPEQLQSLENAFPAKSTAATSDDHSAYRSNLYS